MKIRGVTLRGNWSRSELAALTAALRPLPSHWVERNPGIQSFGRQPRIRNAPPSAPGHSQYDPRSGLIVVFDKGLYHRGKIDHEQFRRSVYHELCHAFLRDKPELFERWVTQTKGDGFVDEYAKTSPAEDICDTFSEYLLHLDKVKKRVPRKAAFIETLLKTESQEKTAMHLISAFADELHKTARAGATNMLKQLGRAAKSSAGRKAIGATAVGGGGAALGHKKGKQSGYDEGTDDVMSVAARARMMGRKEGVMAYHRALMKHQRQSARMRQRAAK